MFILSKLQNLEFYKHFSWAKFPKFDGNSRKFSFYWMISIKNMPYMRKPYTGQVLVPTKLLFDECVRLYLQEGMKNYMELWIISCHFRATFFFSYFTMALYSKPCFFFNITNVFKSLNALGCNKHSKGNENEMRSISTNDKKIILKQFLFGSLLTRINDGSAIQQSNADKCGVIKSRIFASPLYIYFCPRNVSIVGPLHM